MRNFKAIFLLLETLLSLTICFTTIHSQSITDPPFIVNFKGAKKGDTVDDLHKMKEYLAHFGYLSNSNDEKEYNNMFDENLESAIRTYQTNFGLKATGYLDANTIQQMILPRCGVPDIINGTNTMLPRFHEGAHGFGSSYSTSNYKLLGPEWPSYKTIFIYKFIPSDIDPKGINGSYTMQDSLNKWARCAGKQLQFREAPQVRKYWDIESRFYRRDHGDGFPFDGPGGVVAHTFNPPSGRTHYDADEKWSPYPGWIAHFPSVMLHEIGHVFGLAHSSDPRAVMYPSISPGQVKLELAQDDIDGMRALFPA